MPTTRIDDRRDPRLSLYLDLRDRDIRRETGLFMCEGEHVVRRAFAVSGAHPGAVPGAHPGAGLRVRSVLVVESKVDRVEAMIAAAPPEAVGDGVEVLACAKDVMAQAVGIKLHQGIIAAVEPPPPPKLSAVLGRAAGVNPSAREAAASGLGMNKPADGLTPAASVSDVVVVCPEITNVDNLGLLVRVCAGLGVRAMVLGPRCADPWYRRAVRVSMGAVFTMPMVRSADIDADLDRLRDGFGYELVATVIDEDAEALRSVRVEPDYRGALLLGSEGYGLPPDVVRQCDRRVRIPMHHDVDSLNVAVAAGIVIHHFVNGGSRV